MAKGRTSGANKRDIDEFEATEETRAATIIFIIDRSCSIVRLAIKGAIVLGVFYFLFRIVESFSGKKTEFTATASAIVKMQWDRWVAYAFGAAGCGAYYHEKKLRHDVIKKKDAYVKELENRIHPGRGGSSHLDATGETPREKD